MKLYYLAKHRALSNHYSIQPLFEPLHRVKIFPSIERWVRHHALIILENFDEEIVERELLPTIL